jgi:Short C-terminal domain
VWVISEQMFGNKRKREKAMTLVETGAHAIGTLTDVRDTGVSINEQIRVKLQVTIEPLDGTPPFAGEKTTMVSRVRVPPIGARYPIYYDQDDHTSFILVAGLSDEAGRANILAAFGDAFGPDASGVGMPGMAAAAPAAPVPDDPLEQLRKLGELHASGVLTDAEFDAKKAQILGSS